MATEHAMPDLVAVVPLRSPGTGKTRLAPALDPDARAALASAMLADVVAAVRAARVPVVVAAAGDAAIAAAAALDVDVVPDGPGVTSLDMAIEHVRQLGRHHAMLVVQADLPLLARDDVEAVLAADAAVVIAPTDDGGTSALLRRPADVIGTAFGADSGDAHRLLAEAAGLHPAIVRRPGLAHDVDVVGDLHALDPGALGAATTAVLADLGMLDADVARPAR